MQDPRRQALYTLCLHWGVADPEVIAKEMETIDVLRWQAFFEVQRIKWQEALIEVLGGEEGGDAVEPDTIAQQLKRVMSNPHGHNRPLSS